MKTLLYFFSVFVCVQNREREGERETEREKPVRRKKHIGDDEERHV